ncbi:MAG TPA: cupin [Methylophilaceae bacterium]|nr:cupin [Methylophilaceae bacterium]
MSILAIYHQDHPEAAEIIYSHDAISAQLEKIGGMFESWQANIVLAEDANQDSILQAYATQVTRLKEKYNFQSADVISVTSDNPQKAQIRAKFLDEHIHSDFEVRFFVEGKGLFYLHPDEHVYAILCEQGDLISVPAGIKHWFDMGGEPHLKCIRLFTKAEGWVANFTGDTISKSFLTIESFTESFVAKNA